jgi:hypothetical protein
MWHRAEPAATAALAPFTALFARLASKLSSMTAV